MTLAMVELEQVASFTSDFVVGDLCFGFYLDDLCFHENLLSEKFAFWSVCFPLTLG